MKANKRPPLPFPISKWPLVSNRFLHKQNVALYEKLDRMERSLSQQNLVLERIIREQNRQKALREDDAPASDQAELEA